MGRLDGKVALISGGARGQGATEAKLFAQEGAKVVFGDIRDEEGKHVETEIRASGGDAMYMHLDVTQDADWVEAVGTAVYFASDESSFMTGSALVIDGGRSAQ